MVYLRVSAWIYLTVLCVMQAVTAASDDPVEKTIEVTRSQQISSSRNLNNLLAQLKLSMLVIENRTKSPATIAVYDTYHEKFEEDDFSSDSLAVLPVFEHQYEILSQNNRTETEELGITGEKVPQIFIEPYRDQSEANATILRRRVTIFAGKPEKIQAMDSAYIGRLTCETADKYLTCNLSAEGKIEIVIDDRPYFLRCGKIYERDLVTMANSNKLSLPFLDHLLTNVFKAHGFSKEDFFKKLAAIHQSGLAVIDTNITIVPAIFKIPQITHTLLTKKRNGALLSENHQRWLLKSIKTLPRLLGWKHIVWVNEDSAAISSDALGDLNGQVEVRSISESTLTGFYEIDSLIKAGHYHNASALLRYAVLDKHGGVFRGTDTEITQDVSQFHAIFGFYTSVEVNTERMLSSGFLAAAPGHPIIKEALNLSLSHLRNPPRYLTSQTDKLGNYYIKSGNGVLSIAFQKYGMAERDMIFGPKTFNPTRTAADILSFDDPRLILTPEIHAIHYAEGLWRRNIA